MKNSRVGGKTPNKQNIIGKKTKSILTIMQMYYISKNKVNMNIDWSHFAISSLKESVCPDRYNELTQIKKQESYV